MRRRALADGDLDRAHDIAPNWLAYAFECQDFKEHGADEHDGGKQMQGNESEITHEVEIRLHRADAPMV
jgi:hypothetical protein